MDIFFKNDGSYSQSTVGIPVLVDYTPVGFVREVNADMVTCSLFDKFIGKEWLSQCLTTKEPDDEMIKVAIDALERVIPAEKGADQW